MNKVLLGSFFMLMAVVPCCAMEFWGSLKEAAQDFSRAVSNSIDPEVVVYPMSPCVAQQYVVRLPQPKKIARAISVSNGVLSGDFFIVAVHSGGVIELCRSEEVLVEQEQQEVSGLEEDVDCETFCMVSMPDVSIPDSESEQIPPNITLSKFPLPKKTPLEPKREIRTSINCIKLSSLMVPSVYVADPRIQEIARLLCACIADYIQNADVVILDSVMQNQDNTELRQARVLVNGASVGKILLDSGVVDYAGDTLRADGVWKTSKMHNAFIFLRNKGYLPNSSIYVFDSED